jgi:Membrane proteins related to metalloendopeptidases
LKVVKNTFDITKIRIGNKYEVLYTKDTNETPSYFIYEIDKKSHLLLSLKDTLFAEIFNKEITTTKKYAEVSINSSLWNDVQNAGIPGLMAIKLSDIYDCTIDFFGLQKGDSFKVVYDELEYDGDYMSLGNIHYVEFIHQGKMYKAIRYKEGDKAVQFWNEKGESLKKAFLKAPLKFSRISSRFTYARKHPVLKIVRPHTGVDYAAPKGTPVVSVGDGVVVHRGWAGGGGNTIKIKHNATYTTSYMHLSKYAAGLKKGDRVSQGQLIGYVGSTGWSTGPHLDYRVYKNGKPIDPLKMESPSVEPIAKKYMQDFNSVAENCKYQIDSIQSVKHLNSFLNLLL